MRRFPRWLVPVAIVLVLALGGLASLSIATARQSLPDLDGRVALPGLDRPVEVLRDVSGVPQIYADNAEDLFEAQGFVAAQDRFFEMDVRRHTAAGRLSELFGPSQTKTDTYIRTLGWRLVAEQELALLAPSTRRYLDAYASGVNAYLRGRSAGELSLEYTVLGFRGGELPAPEPWTAADSVSWLKVMGWQLAANADDEAARAVITTKVGAARAADLYPLYPYADFAPIVGRGTVVGKAFAPNAGGGSARPLSGGLSRTELSAAAPALQAVARARRGLPEFLGSDGLSGETGSNSWAVAGSRTASGGAMLSNDPHLDTSIPSTFVQIGLHCRAVSAACPFDVAGFSLAAIPGVVIGRNADIAWGMTTSYVDVQDLYVEELRGEAAREGDRFVPLTTRTEQLLVRGEDDPRTITIRASRHGPLLSDVDPTVQQAGSGRLPPETAYAVALAWTGLTPGRSMDAVFGIDAARDFTQFRKAAALLSAPSQNLVYADVRGNIGYQLPGAIPRRGAGDGTAPSPGWDSQYDWRGTIPRAELPYAYNPPEGVIVAANQPVIGRQYPRDLGSSYSYGWRSQQLLDRLDDLPELTPDAAAALFADDEVRVADELVPALLKVKVADGWVAEGQRTLVGWDYRATSTSAAAAYFAVVVHNILKSTFRDELPEDQWPAGGDRWYAVIGSLLKQPKNAWWDDVGTPNVIETRDDILLAAMTQARKEITSLMARDTDQWQWGTLHTVTLRNSTLGISGVGPVERLLNRGHFAVGGGPAVVNAMAYDDREGYAVTQAPTMRMLVDLGDPDASRWISQSGTSGHAFSPNYDDQTPLWATDQMLPFAFRRAAVEGRTVNRLELVATG